MRDVTKAWPTVTNGLYDRDYVSAIHSFAAVETTKNNNVSSNYNMGLL